MTRPRPHRLAVAAACSAVALVGLSACDTGDGTTLRDPTAPTTQPEPTLPPETTLPGDAEIADPAIIDTAPTTLPASDVDDATPPAGLNVSTPFVDGSTIELRYTCDGSNAAPPISWTGIPEGTQEIAIALVDETDITNGRPFINWVMTGIDPETAGIDENEVPPGAVQALNFFGDVGYTGPCPDPAFSSDFTLSVFAIEQQLEFVDGTPAAQMLDLLEPLALAIAEVPGTATR